jgi:hypothetical protein
MKWFLLGLFKLKIRRTAILMVCFFATVVLPSSELFSQIVVENRKHNPASPNDKVWIVAYDREAQIKGQPSDKLYYISSARSLIIRTTLKDTINGGVNLDFQKTSLAFFANDDKDVRDNAMITNNYAQPLVIAGLEMLPKTPNAGGAPLDFSYTLNGPLTITDKMTLNKGKIKIGSSPTSELLYRGSEDALLGSDASKPNVKGSSESYVKGRFFRQGSGSLSFPIGNENDYFPARLDGVSAVDPKILIEPLGLEVISANPGFVKTPDLKDIFTSHFWEFSTTVSTAFSGNTQISLSDNTSGFFGTDGDATILELNATGVQEDLFGSPNNGFYTSTKPMSASGKYYGLAKADEITVRIRKLITPNDDLDNDVLVVDGLDAFPDNKITLIDRWGVVVNTWKGFVNYPEPAGVKQPDFDFSKLAVGNYICVVEYTERGARKSKKQMIAVLK